jgi:gliding motility-associated-like protein
VIIIFNQNPSTAAAGSDQLTLCGLTSTSLSANTPTVGTGSWTVVSGLGGSFVSATNPTTTFNGLAGNSYTLQWTISNTPCTTSFDDVNIIFNQDPTTSAAGSDQLAFCGLTSTSLSANTPAVGTGSWTVVSGLGGSFVSATNPTTSFNGIAGNSYTLQWSISNAPCTASSDDVSIAFNQNPSTSAAGSDQLTLCGLTSTSLSANTPVVGNGSWTVVSGLGGSFVSATNPTTTFNGIAGNSYTLQWTISNAPCTASSDDVSIAFNQNPSASAAGSDQLTLCGLTSTSLSANTSAVGTGSWTVISGLGGSFISAINPTTTFNGIAGNSYTLQWIISNPPCIASFDDVIIIFNQNPSTASAGTDQSTCFSSVILTANVANIGSGSWSVVSGIGGNFIDTFDPNSTFAGLAGNSYTLAWTISNPPCLASSDQVTVHFNESPTIAKVGANESVCGRSVTLIANTPVIGTGAWSRISGGGDLTAVNSPTTSVNNLTTGLNEFVWKISTLNCPASADTIGVLSDESPSQAFAGNNLATALDKINLDAETPLVGIGKWSLLSGQGIFDDAFNPKTGFTFVSNGQSNLLWTVSNGVCPAVSDTLLVNKQGLLVPEIITPNNDGNNDYFYLPQADYFNDIKLEVYNRWGSLEYSNSSYKNEFNGKNSKGVDLADDTYFILLSIPGQNVHSGYLIIKRR